MASLLHKFESDASRWSQDLVGERKFFLPGIVTPGVFMRNFQVEPAKAAIPFREGMVMVPIIAYTPWLTLSQFFAYRSKTAFTSPSCRNSCKRSEVSVSVIESSVVNSATSRV